MDTTADDSADPEIAGYIDNLPRYMTYAEIAAALVCRFGKRRAWGADRIMRYWMAKAPARVNQPSRLDRDPELAAFVEDRLGRLTLDALVTACRERFGADRAPSRSALGRHALRRRAEMLRERPQGDVEAPSKAL